AQAIRFFISGVFPNIEGLEAEPEMPKTNSVIMELYTVGASCTVIAIAVALNLGHEAEEEGEAALEGSVLHRIGEISTSGFAMLFAWCTLFSTRWICVKYPIFLMPSIMGRVLLALVLSIFAGLMVFLLDVIDDAARERAGAEAGTKAIRTIIQALAILVGFSWEHCFDGGVAAVASTTANKAVTKFCLGTFVFLFLVPAWRRHILTKVMALE
ncbi:unnamed protein product, partial [Polarella glacialis]